jgi:hypothetical protein
VSALKEVLAVLKEVLAVLKEVLATLKEVLAVLVSKEPACAGESLRNMLEMVLKHPKKPPTSSPP